MLRDRFKEEATATLPQWKVNHINFIMSKLDEYESKSGKRIEDGWDESEFIKFFNSCNVRHASNFGHYRTALISYVEYLERHTDVRMLSEVERIRFSGISYDMDDGVVSFYTSVEQLLSAIDESISYELTHGVTIDAHRYDIAKCALLLLWYGFTQDELVNVEKRDVIDFGVMKNGSLVYMPPEIVEVLKDCINSQGYVQQARGEIFRTYKDSKYLFRSPMSEQATLTSILSQISVLNNIFGRRLSLSAKVAYHSGLYFRVYMAQCANPKLDLSSPENFTKYFEAEKYEQSKCTRYLQEFAKYKKLLTQQN